MGNMSETAGAAAGSERAGSEPASEAPARSARRLLRTVLPALVVGVGSSLLFLLVEYISEALEHFLWEFLPDRFGFAGSGKWWIVAVLTATGLAVGLVVAFVPGHAGPDPATEGLIGPPLPTSVIPSLLLAAILALGGGVSLGPENPITAANIALACAVGVRLAGRETAPLWLALAAAGTIGALFGTPVAAALIMSEMAFGPTSLPLWDRLFAPLIAAGAGALTTQAFAEPSFAIDVPPYAGFHLIDLVSACGMALAGGLLGLAIVYPFAAMHALFRRLRNPIVMLTAGGLLLGVLGAIGGMITLFKGLSQMRELVSTVSAYSTWGLVVVVAVKAAALLIASAAEFRGGRIFPTVFLGVALGLLGNRLIPGIPESLAIGAALLGIVVAITHQGWLSLFLAGTVTMDIRLFPILCIAVLPVWLLIIGKPEMQLPHEQPATA